MTEAGSFLSPYLGGVVPWLYQGSGWWTVFGLSGNLLFSSRFVYQWLLSEKQGRLLVPRAFWYLSFWGSLVSLIYAFHIDKAPVILGYVFLPVLYGRNLVLLHRGEKVKRGNGS